MLSFESRLGARILIYAVAGGIILGSLLYSNYLAQQFQAKEREEMQLFADALRFITDMSLNQDDPNAAAEAFAFISEIVVNTGDDIPKILLGEAETVDSHTLEIPEGQAEREFLLQKITEFQAEYAPIKVEFDTGRFQTVVYGQSDLLKRLRWFPLIQLLVAFCFIGIVFVGFAIAKRNEQNRVWVGLAKETAHQLGTPVSSLMAWIELLKLNAEDRPEEQELIGEMEQDVRRLENIAERFSKIGSVPELIEVKLKTVLDRSAEYIKKRMTRGGRIQLFVNNQIPLDSELQINPQLFDWVIENLLKNALDAIQSSEGSITIEAGERGPHYFIEVTDTGKGIPKNNFKKVFEPGFTTKKRGWGLGLSLTKRIVENYHKGKIFVKASEPGVGTTFRILLPK
ncbi:MAG: HAMP domain-containing sensor histidine kinase [Bacteroidota bacterium]